MSSHSKKGLSWLLGQIRSGSILNPNIMSECFAQLDSETTASEAQAYVRFDPENYARNVVLNEPNVQVLVLCWRSSQASRPHDHGSSNCGVYVLSGTVTETLYSELPSPDATPDAERNASVLAVREWTSGSFTASEGSYVHRIENRHATDLVTLHVYSPPLIKIGA